MPNQIEAYRLTRFAFPRDRPIGDSQVKFDTIYLAVLELMDTLGHTGTGFMFSAFHPFPGLAEMTRVVELEVKPAFLGQAPAALTHRLSRPRGGNIRDLPYNISEAIDQASWDLLGQELGLPLYRLWGARSNRVRAYASGLDYHLSDEACTAFYQQAMALGFGAFKVKIGHPDLEWDLARLRLVRRLVGDQAPMMVDANEAWSPGEAIRRLHAYHAAGLEILWVEDPCLRYDFDGLREIMRGAPFTLVNTGEYLGLRDKRRLIEAGAVDILNIHGNLSDSLRAAWLANDHGLQVSVGNTFFELGVHLAAALPGDTWMEFHFPNYNFLLETPVVFENGYAVAPDRPGHGLRLSEQARAQYAQPEIQDVSGMTPPPGLIHWPQETTRTGEK
jgi:L-alanine-DL-glutamate epimerase-like enolase superfamily enzyme